MSADNPYTSPAGRSEASPSNLTENSRAAKIEGLTSPLPASKNLQLVAVAKHQKRIIWLLLASIVAWVIPYGPVITGLIAIVLVYELAKALKFKDTTGILILSLIPIVKLFVLLYVNRKATVYLRSYNVGVGLMGANKDDLARALVRD